MERGKGVAELSGRVEESAAAVRVLAFRDVHRVGAHARASGIRMTFAVKQTLSPARPGVTAFEWAGGRGGTRVLTAGRAEEGY